MGWSNIFIHKTEKHHELSSDKKVLIADNFNEFYEAIKQKRLVEMKYLYKGESITRTCVPFDYGMFRKRPYRECFHAKTIGVRGGDYTLHLEPSDVESIKMLEESFNPKDYVKWSSPYRWRLPRNWGEYS